MNEELPFAEELHRWRLAIGWTLRRMAMELRVSPTYVHMLERAKRNPSPSLALLVRHLMKETPEGGET